MSLYLNILAGLIILALFYLFFVKREKKQALFLSEFGQTAIYDLMILIVGGGLGKYLDGKAIIDINFTLPGDFGTGRFMASDGTAFLSLLIILLISKSRFFRKKKPKPIKSNTLNTDLSYSIIEGDVNNLNFNNSIVHVHLGENVAQITDEKQKDLDPQNVEKQSTETVNVEEKKIDDTSYVPDVIEDTEDYEILDEPELKAFVEDVMSKIETFSEPYLYKLANYLYMIGEISCANDITDELINRSADNVNARALKGNILYMTGYIDLSYQIFNQLLTGNQEPMNKNMKAHILNRLGDIKKMMGDFKSAEDFYSRATKTLENSGDK